mmetsp:Transcript_17507/g.30625  ORF Transcript_17507/g.30625 Transcript_17507/m.30625 type:complete len:123 (-) Transcript_17507:75-443(-)
MTSKKHIKGTAHIAVIGDEDTVTGFLLAGVGGVDAKRQPNVLVVDNDTKQSDIEHSFKHFTNSSEVAILLISQPIAEKIRYLVSQHDKLLPTILEIPTKENPYDPTKDSIMQQIQKITGVRS